MAVEIALNDTVRLRKPHPCGGYEWRVVRLGADIGLKCTGCGRRILLTRREVARRVRTTVRRGEAELRDDRHLPVIVPPPRDEV